jgi:hypothetical protein
MIALQSLKYKIFEWCIDTLVGKLVNNFTSNSNGLVKIKVYDLKPGMHLTEIKLQQVWETPPQGYIVFGNCTITRMTSFLRFTQVWFSFETLNGKPHVDRERTQTWDVTPDSTEMEFFV